MRGCPILEKRSHFGRGCAPPGGGRHARRAPCAQAALLAILALAVGYWGGCKSSARDPGARSSRAAPRPGLRSPAELPGVKDLREAYGTALRALQTGRKAAAERSLRKVHRVLGTLEREARRACRQVQLPPGAPRGPEASASCRALAGLSAINDDLAERLDPGGPLAEQVDVLARLRRLLATRLGVVGFTGGPFERPGPAVSVASLEAAPTKGAPRRALSRRCWAARPRVLDPHADGALALGRIAGALVVVWRSEGGSRRPSPGRQLSLGRRLPLGRQSLRDSWRLARLDQAGQSVQGSASQVGLALDDADRGAPFSILDTGADALVVTSRDGDPWALRFDAQGRPVPRWSPRPVLVRGAGFSPGCGAAMPRPAWLSQAGKGRVLELRLFDGATLRPAGRTRLLGASADPGASLFGAPSLLGQRGAHGDPGRFWVAFSTLDALHVVRLDARGRPVGPMRKTSWPVPRGAVARCTLLAAGAKAVFALVIAEPSVASPGQSRARNHRWARRGARSGARLGLLAAFTPSGLPARLPMVVSLPPGIGCPARLRVVSGRLVLVGTVAGAGGDRDRELGWVELTPGGKVSRLARLSESAATLGGALVSGDRLVVAFRRDRRGSTAVVPPGGGTPRELGGVVVRQIRCSAGKR